MSKKPLTQLFFEALEVSREGREIAIINGFTRDEADHLTVLAFMPDYSPNHRWEAISALIGDPNTVEAIFGVDRYTRPGQQVETASLITFYHWDKNYDSFGGWRFGIVPYDEAGCREPSWDHPFWTPIQRLELDAQVKRADARSVEYLGRLGFPPEAHSLLLEELRLAEQRGEGLGLSAETGRLLLERVRARLRGESITRVH